MAAISMRHGLVVVALPKLRGTSVTCREPSNCIGKNTQEALMFTGNLAYVYMKNPRAYR